MKKIILCIALVLGAYIQPSMAQTNNLSVKFNQSLQRYYALKNALAADKAEEAAKAASALALAIKEVPHKGFTTDAQHQFWMKESKQILAQTAVLGESTDLKVQRKSFEGISASMIRLAEELKLNTTAAYVQYCPMGKFSWLNEVKAIQNPYYGSEMFDCGTIKETIANK